jgi:minor extracellular protease Epr
VTVRLLLVLLFIFAPLAPPVLVDGGVWRAAGVVLADDDDDDDDDDDGGGGSESGPAAGPATGPGLLDRFFRRSRAQPAPPPPPEQSSAEIVVLGLDAAARDVVTAAGYEIARTGGDLVLLRLPEGTSPDAAIAELAVLAPAAVAAPNHYYRPQQAPCEAGICADWDVAGVAPANACGFSPLIGVVDTGVNLEHDMLAGAAIDLDRFGDAAAEMSKDKHGTAIAAMFVGRPESRVPGLLPDARLVVADPFTSVGADERADAFSLYLAIAALLARDVDVVSLSLAGPDNPILARIVAEAHAGGTPIVAAVGNAGPRAAPLYPAAYDSVVAVTAVDRKSRIYRRAIQGPQVDLAAPGVEVPTAASISGVRPQTGTSFAVPFVTTALAVQRARLPEASPAELLAALGRTDLGEPGRDPVFGEGLVAVGSLCP